MCLNRLYIRSNKLDYNGVVDRLYNYVPCGYCEECLETKQSDVLVRLLYHHDYIKLHNGCTFYFTLTYDNMSLPRFLGKPVFNKQHIVRFVDNIRHLFPKDTFSYFMTSEYGGETFRPHYHFLMFCTFKVSVQDFHDMINKYWPYGRVDWSKNSGLVIGSRPLSYVAKYISKDTHFLNSLLQKKRFTPYDCETFRVFKDLYTADLEIIPFSLRSNGIGSYMAETLSFNNLVDGYVYRVDDLGISKKYMIPLYILRKTLKYHYKNVNGNVSYAYTEFGLSVLRERLKRKIKDSELEFQLLYKQILPTYVVNFQLNTKFAYDDVKQLCSSFESSFNFYDLSVYTHFYRGLSVSPSGSFDDDFDSYVMDYLFPSGQIEKYEFRVALLDRLIFCLDSVRNLGSYDIYARRQGAYNARQILLSAKTGKSKIVPVKSFAQFCNEKTDNLCLTILSARTYVNDRILKTPSRFSSLLKTA